MKPQRVDFSSVRAYDFHVKKTRLRQEDEPIKADRLIVIGSSAGGMPFDLDALTQLVDRYA